jgi:ubiquinone/menaquinone biosynthesis C-methylase UbiE
MDSSAELTVCDISTEMIGVARDRLNDDIITFWADAQSLPFENESFDRILANLNLNLIPDTEACLKEAHRVLKKNGCIVYSVWGRPEHSPLMTILPHSAAQLGIPLPKRGRSNFHLGTGKKLKSMMEDCGFSDVLQWYQPMIEPIFSGDEYVSWMKNQLEMMDLQGTIKNDLIEILSMKADALLRAGQPISLDVRVVVGQKL